MAGQRGSSEDDLPLWLNHAQDRGVGRGLNPAPDERGPAAFVSMTGAHHPSKAELEIRWMRAGPTSADAGAQTLWLREGGI